MTNTLIVLVGPTGIGKTDLSLKLAKTFGTEIISADSRQIFKELKIGTAAPTQWQLDQVPHHLVGTHSITDYYSAWQFEQDVIQLCNRLFVNHQAVLMTGGSMMYIDAVCNGIDEIPTIDQELRDDLMAQFNNFGIEHIKGQLKRLDPVFYNEVDLKNHKRVIHALEVCLMTGLPYSQLRTNKKVDRPFKIIKIGLTMDRDTLYNRINQRVDQMVKDGLLKEARQFYHLKHENSLNTVGYKELFAHWDGDYDEATAIELIKRNSRRYAKRQLSWFRRDKEIVWFEPSQADEIITFVERHK